MNEIHKELNTRIEQLTARIESLPAEQEAAIGALNQAHDQRIEAFQSSLAEQTREESLQLQELLRASQMRTAARAQQEQRLRRFLTMLKTLQRDYSDFRANPDGSDS